MNDTDSKPPRRKWNFAGWIVIVMTGLLVHSGWRVYAFRSALAKARAQGWAVFYLAPSDAIRENWRAAFDKGTWIAPVSIHNIQTSEAFEQNIATIRRLNPIALGFAEAPSLPDPALFNSISALESIALDKMDLNQRNLDTLAQIQGLRGLILGHYKGALPQNAFGRFKNLTSLEFFSCQDIATLDPLKNLTNLQIFTASDCDRLTDVSALANFTDIKRVTISNCRNVTEDALAPLGTALPKTVIDRRIYVY
jgi:hypothetical protein